MVSKPRSSAMMSMILGISDADLVSFATVLMQETFKTIWTNTRKGVNILFMVRGKIFCISAWSGLLPPGYITYKHGLTLKRTGQICTKVKVSFPHQFALFKKSALPGTLLFETSQAHLRNFNPRTGKRATSGANDPKKFYQPGRTSGILIHILLTP